MPTGIGVFDPAAKFGFTRGYLWGINIRVSTSVTQDGRFFHFPDGGDPSRIFTVGVREKVFVWTSNHYTLDFVIDESYYVDSIPPFTHEMNYTLAWYTGDPPGRSELLFYPFGIIFPQMNRFALPPAPPGYWYPPFT